MKVPLSTVTVAALSMICWADRSARADEIKPEAVHLAAIVDSLDVEHRWPAGVHVTWDTGIPDGRAETAVGKHTHCSAFVAAAAQRLGVYILRPPAHPQRLLANAQYDWLAEQGRQNGWSRLRDAVEAQASANHGSLVVAIYRNHDDGKPGHVAIVRPSDKSLTALRAEGPQITQAGGTNYRSTTLRRGFAGHPAAWSRGEVRYYAHETSLSAKRIGPTTR